MTVQLGSAFDGQTTPALGLQQMVDAITRQVLAQVMAQYKSPVVNVAPPSVNVAAPQVHMDAPAVDAPAVNVSPEVNVEVPGFEALAAEVKGLRADVAKLIGVLGAPTVRDVHRDVNGLIDRVTDHR